MSSIIHKYILNKEDVNIITVPIGSKFLSFQNQITKNENGYTNNAVIWVGKPYDNESVVENIKYEKWEIKLFPTGLPIENFANAVYLGTAQFYDGTLVLHAFAKGIY